MIDPQYSAEKVASETEAETIVGQLNEFLYAQGISVMGFPGTHKVQVCIKNGDPFITMFDTGVEAYSWALVHVASRMKQK